MDDPNGPETEEDGIRAEALRRLKVRQLSSVREANAGPERSLDNAEEYLAWAITYGMRTQAGSVGEPGKPAED